MVKISKFDTKDTSIDTAKKILSDDSINIKSLPGYGNSGLKRKEIINNIKKMKAFNRCRKVAILLFYSLYGQLILYVSIF